MQKSKKNGRAKGARGEREVAGILKTWWGSDFARTPSSGGFKTKRFRDDWNAEGDVVTPDTTFPFSVEIKHREGWTLDHVLTSPASPIWDWWNQAISQGGDSKIPLLIFKRNFMPWMFLCKNADIPNVDVGTVISLKDPHGNIISIGLLLSLVASPKDKWIKNVLE